MTRMTGRYACAIGGLLIASAALLPTVSGDEPKVSSLEMLLWAQPPQSPHRVVKQPQLLTSKQSKHRAIHDAIHPPVATIQAAVLAPGWRQPYAYGFFGPTPHRHPQRHFGARQDYTQWTWK